MILQADNITKQYASHLALDGVSISVPRGSIYGLLGPNGAGKTTLIRIINQITAPDSGSILFDGKPLAPADVAQIGYLPEERGLYKKMKVGEQALYLARLKGLSYKNAERALREWFARFDVSHWWNRRVEELSKGMAQKVQFIITALHKPKLLIFDEPFSGFDPINVNLLKREILALRSEGASVIFSTHNMASVEELCDYITLINKSRNILSGQIDEVRRRHGDNVFEINYRGDAQAAREAIGDDYAVAGESERQFYRQIVVRCHHREAGNALLERIAAKVEVAGFSEIMPSMNDIFIKLVNTDK